MSDAELKRALRERAYLEGDFVLRSGSVRASISTSTGSRRSPDLLEAIAARIAAAVAEAEPDAVRLAAPELGAVPLAAGASLASRLPYLIVRGQAKEYGTANRIEGHFEPGEKVCLVEDVVTTGGAAVEAIQALRESGLECRTAVCVVDREEGGATRWPVSAFGYARSSAQPRFSRPEKPRKTRMVEPIRRGCYAHQAVNDPEGRSCW